jgi:hypothetical protein
MWVLHIETKKAQLIEESEDGKHRERPGIKKEGKNNCAN